MVSLTTGVVLVSPQGLNHFPGQRISFRHTPGTCRAQLVHDSSGNKGQAVPQTDFSRASLVVEAQATHSIRKAKSAPDLRP